MMRQIGFSAAMIAILAGSGCSWFNQSSEFDRIPPGKQLEVPPDLDEPDDRNSLRIPNSTYSRVSGGPVSRSGNRAAAPEGQGTRFAYVGGDAVLVVDDSVEGTYRRLSFALERVGLKVLSSNEASRFFDVEYTDTEARANRPGVFSRWILRRKGPTDHSGTYRVTVTDTEGDEESVVTMVDENGSTAPERVAEEILKALEARLT